MTAYSFIGFDSKRMIRSDIQWCPCPFKSFGLSPLPFWYSSSSINSGFWHTKNTLKYSLCCIERGFWAYFVLIPVSFFWKERKKINTNHILMIISLLRFYLNWLISVFSARSYFQLSSSILIVGIFNCMHRYVLTC